MPEPEDPLAHTTARLSISQINNDGVDANETRNQLLQMLNSSNNERRESVVSFEDIDEDSTSPSPGLADTIANNSKLTPIPKPSKRRRSSVQSITPASSDKKVHKKKLKKINEPPAFQLAVRSKKNPPLKLLSIPQLRDLVLYTLTPHSNAKPNWIEVVKKEQINKFVVIFVPGLEMEDFDLDQKEVENDEVKAVKLGKKSGVQGDAADDKQNEEDEGEDLQFFYDNFVTLLKTTCPGTKDSIYLPFHAFTHVPFTAKEKKKLIEDLKKRKLTLIDLLLDNSKMVKFGYPVHSESEGADSEGYYSTRKFDHEGSHTFAMDCEFCIAGTGKVLTRISIVNFQGEVVLDKYVQPEEKITDYVTKYSGITPEKLEGVTTTLKDIQNELLELVSLDDILIGHSLESDLNVLKLKHPRIIDTAVVYEHPRGPPSKPSLKWLADKHLSRSIQQGESDNSGHSSVEDAQACLDLIKMKLIEGSCFGTNMTEMSIYERLNKSVGKPVSSLLIDYQTSNGGGGANCATLDEELYHLIKKKASNDDEIVEIFEKEINGDYSLVLVKLRELEFNREWSTPPSSFSPRNDETTGNEAILKKFNERMTKIYSVLPNDTGLIVTSSQGNPRDMIKLQGMRREFQSAERAGETSEVSWDFDKALALLEATIRARKAVTFLTVYADSKKNADSNEDDEV